MTGRHVAQRPSLRQRLASGLVGDDPNPEPATPVRLVSSSGPDQNAAVAGHYARVAEAYREVACRFGGDCTGGPLCPVPGHLVNVADRGYQPGHISP
jgi:hypothetical protein